MSLFAKTQISTALPIVSQVFRPLPAVARFYTTKATYSKSETTQKSEEAFNKEVSNEEIEENIKDYNDFVSGKASSKTYVESHFKGFESLKDKGEKTAEEQDRPEDFM